MKESFFTENSLGLERTFVENLAKLIQRYQRNLARNGDLMSWKKETPTTGDKHVDNTPEIGPGMHSQRQSRAKRIDARFGGLCNNGWSMRNKQDELELLV